MSRSHAALGSRRIDRRTLLGATMGVAASAGLSRSAAMGPGRCRQWGHHLLASLHQRFRDGRPRADYRPVCRAVPRGHDNLGEHSERRLHDPVHDCRRRRLASQHHHGRGRPDSRHAGAWRADRSDRAVQRVGRKRQHRTRPDERCHDRRPDLWRSSVSLRRLALLPQGLVRRSRPRGAHDLG